MSVNSCIMISTKAYGIKHMVFKTMMPFNENTHKQWFNLQYSQYLPIISPSPSSFTSSIHTHIQSEVEYQKQYGCIDHSTDNGSTPLLDYTPPTEDVSLPVAVDWHTKGAVAAVKDQVLHGISKTC